MTTKLTDEQKAQADLILNVLIVELPDRGLVLSYGDEIAGPWVCDGTIRIYDPESMRILAQGRSLLRVCEDFLNEVGAPGIAD